jgi:hypothetical protein
MSKIVEAAQAGGKMGKMAPAGGGKQEAPKGDGLKTAWKPERGGKIGMPMAKKKVRWVLPPHFPQPDADPIALLEAALAEKDEAISFLYAEAKAWQGQLDVALARIKELEATWAP